MAASPVYAGGVFLKTAYTAAGNTAEVTLTADCRITTFTALLDTGGSPFTMSVSILAPGASDYVAVAGFEDSGTPTRAHIQAETGENMETLVTGSGSNGTPVFPRGIIPAHLPSGTKIKVGINVSTNIYLAVSGLTLS